MRLTSNKATNDVVQTVLSRTTVLLCRKMLSRWILFGASITRTYETDDERNSNEQVGQERSG